MTIHLITVGTTARRFISDPPPPRHPVQALIGASGQPLDGDILAVNVNDPSTVAGFLAQLAADVDPVVQLAKQAINSAGFPWPSDASAETSSLTAVTQRPQVGPRDLVILLSTDTGEGLLSAFWNAAVMLGGELTRLDYLSDPPQTDVGIDEHRLLARHAVLIARIPHLDVGRHDRLGLGMRKLGHLGRLILASLQPGEDIAVHLSGGYKATIPFLLGIAEGLRSIPVSAGGELASVSAYVVHEDSGKKIDVPLRRLKPVVLREELSRFDSGGRSPVVSAATSLEGYAYERDGREWCLTAFGEGFKALMGDLPPVVNS